MGPRMLPIILLDIYIEYILILLFVRRSLPSRGVRYLERSYYSYTKVRITTAFYYTYYTGDPSAVLGRASWLLERGLLERQYVQQRWRMIDSIAA